MLPTSTVPFLFNLMSIIWVEPRCVEATTANFLEWMDAMGIVLQWMTQEFFEFGARFILLPVLSVPFWCAPQVRSHRVSATRFGDDAMKNDDSK